MASNRNAWMSVGVSAALIAAGTGLYRAGATSITPSADHAPAAPTAVALVDLPRLTKGLNEVKDRNAQLDAEGRGYQKDLDDLSAKLKKIEEDVKLMPADSKEGREKFFEGVKLEAEAKATQQILRKKIELRAGEILTDVYSKMQETVKRISERDGYQLVLVDDRAVSLPKNGTDEDVNKAILNKRILYAAPTVDITDQVISEMNNAYDTASGKKK